MRDRAATWPWLILLGVVGVFAFPLAKPSAPGPPPPTSDAKPDQPKPAADTKDEKSEPLRMQHPFRPHWEFLGKSVSVTQPKGQAANEPIMAPSAADVKSALKPYDHTILIAIVPDPSNAKLASEFDGNLEAIQRAIENQGYVPDARWMPWPRTGREHDSENKWKIAYRLWERLPGTVLFRGNEPGTDRLLTVFLVGSTPTTGIDKQAFVNAAQYAAELATEDASAEIRVVGPAYSGSAHSIRSALQQLRDKWRGGPMRSMRIVSGSAVGIRPDDLCKGFTDGPIRLSYQTTVILNEDLVKAINRFIRRSPGNVAVLQESNTAFGQSFKAPDQSWVTIPFPLHISYTLEAISKDRSRQAEARRLPAPGLSLPFPREASFPGTETSAPFDPAMTNALNDLVLGNILSTISRENIRYVGLLATDARDKLFLAAMIREHCPDVRLFTTEGNLLLAHPGYAFAMRGALVATTYPLHPSLQRYTDPYDGDEKRLLFSQQIVQGTYNAVLAQLGRPEKMIGYAVPRAYRESPATPCITRPPVWLCEVSPTGRLVPLRFDTEGQDGWDYLVERPAIGKRSPLELRYDPLWASAVLVLSLACGLLFMWARRAMQRNGTTAYMTQALARLFWPDAPARATGPAQRAGTPFPPMTNWKLDLAVFSCLAPLAELYALLAYLALIPFLLNWHKEIAEGGWGFYLSPLGLIVLALCGWWWWRAGGREAWTRPQHTATSWARPAVPVTIGVAVVVALLMTGRAGLFLHWTFPLIVLGTLVGLLALLFQIGRPRVAWFRWLGIWLRWIWGWATTRINGREVDLPPGQLSSCVWLGVGATVVLALGAALFGRVRDMTVEDALTFERAVDLSSGLSTVLPAFFLTMVFCSWGFFQLKADHLLEHYSVANPFTSSGRGVEPALFKNIKAYHEEVGRSLAATDWSLPAHLKSFWFIYVLAGLPMVYLFWRAQPTFEGILFDLLVFTGFAIAVMVLGLTFAHFLLLWKTVRGILKRLSMMPLDRAFDNLPAEVAGMFSGYLYTSRPRRSHFAVPVRQFTRLQQLAQPPDFYGKLQQESGCDNDQRNDLEDALRKDIAGDFQNELTDASALDSTVGDSLQELRSATAAVLAVLQGVWNRHPPDEVPRKPSSSLLRDILQWLQGRWLLQTPPAAPPATPTPAGWMAVRAEEENAAVWEWVRMAENLVATQAVLYVSQFFVQLRNLLLSVTVGTLLLLLAATSYPFQPQSLFVVYLLVMVGFVTVGTVTVLVQINRNSFVSRLSNTTPDRFTPDWAFLSSFATYVLPLLGVLAVQLSGSFRVWLEPVFRVLK
jgi:hypothetical protein